LSLLATHRSDDPLALRRALLSEIGVPEQPLVAGAQGPVLESGAGHRDEGPEIRSHEELDKVVGYVVAKNAELDDRLAR
jgi:hypothetical protein